MNSLIEEWTVGFTAEEVMDWMQSSGIPAGIVQNAEDLRSDPQLRERGCFWEMSQPVIGGFPHLGQPSRLSKTPAMPNMPAACLGEHTEKVCTQMLGMSDNEFLDLYQAGAFG